MKIFKIRQIRDIDAYTIEHEPVSSVDLMERAAVACFHWLKENMDCNRPVKIIVGPGNNGGDGLALARMLILDNRQVKVFIPQISEKFSHDAMVNYQRLMDLKPEAVVTLGDAGQFPDILPEDIVIDALFGSGLSRPLSGLAAEIVDKLNNSSAVVVAIDIPSGLQGDINCGDADSHIVKASHTLSFQFPKLSFFLPENEVYVGRFHVLDIGLHPEMIQNLDTDYYFPESQDISSCLKNRRKFSHKGNFGHALLISGRYGQMGAAVMASRACLRAGVGLLTVQVPRCGYNIMQSTVPEAMVKADRHKNYLSLFPALDSYSAIGVGPGIGLDMLTKKMFFDLLHAAKAPLVIDADAINILGDEKEWLNFLPTNTVLTPHPKEFERITQACSNSAERHRLQVEFARKYGVVVVLKGANTIIACPDGRCFINSTGNPGMATAGSGDTLTGIILSLLAQGYASWQAAVIGVYIHGLAGDLAAQAVGQEAMIASDIINHLGKAFIYLHKNEKNDKKLL
ncbi:MAG: NAD(P)H-hydrate dehydratase [Bacteroidota bacterium]|nr:NAD(P)H-hydrate dehydratase [Bacteroidota bacterium]